MIIKMNPDAKEELVQAVVNVVVESGHRHHFSYLGKSVTISVNNKNGSLSHIPFEKMEGVMKVFHVEVTLPVPSESFSPALDSRA